MERDPDQLRRVYETGRAVAQIQVDKIRAFLETAKAEAEDDHCAILGQIKTGGTDL